MADSILDESGGGKGNSGEGTTGALSVVNSTGGDDDQRGAARLGRDGDGADGCGGGGDRGLGGGCDQGGRGGGNHVDGLGARGGSRGRDGHGHGGHAGARLDDDGAGLLDGADGGGDGDDDGGDGGRVSGAVGHGGGARGDGVDRGRVDGRGGPLAAAAGRVAGVHGGGRSAVGGLGLVFAFLAVGRGPVVVVGNDHGDDGEESEDGGLHVDGCEGVEYSNYD
jgi:hypothetical protein